MTLNYKLGPDRPDQGLPLSLHFLGLMTITYFFRAIFDLSNKIALLILLRMYALYVKKKKMTKIENESKE